MQYLVCPQALSYVTLLYAALARGKTSTAPNVCAVCHASFPHETKTATVFMQ